MCYYKPNKPPCTCHFLQLVQPCAKAVLYPSPNENPAPLIQVCPEQLIARGVGQRHCVACCGLFSPLDDDMALRMYNTANLTNPGGLKAEEIDAARFMIRSPSPFPGQNNNSVSVLKREEDRVVASGVGGGASGGGAAGGAGGGAAAGEGIMATAAPAALMAPSFQGIIGASGGLGDFGIQGLDTVMEEAFEGIGEEDWLKFLTSELSSPIREAGGEGGKKDGAKGGQ
ncbi:hypothetical protein BO70DRAFT_401837 [Aspergillus heteromorphus CBS 117.55]|uniref:Uncharacterized protein n=1 Tax=Aspergillus heteromorphus CBS 117.55 TaxID=1448321 RepID=A0A317X198_9EURO|nr:uncharacterized protein BO70DRAFT_401837 [Aspergillus heteromorphus CBS 117.55]PWY92085.1 hypothetical protein BO70DRAFT_401837 [Aspergillus heteromorphus CBS 117.55]